MMKLLARHYKLIIAWGIVAALLSGGLSFLLPMQYSADSQVLIISRDRAGIDPYTQAKSAERVGENLAQVMKTADFYNKVMSSESQFDKDVWTRLIDRQQRKKWNKDVQASIMFGTGIMNIKVYAANQGEAVSLSNAITQVLVAQGYEYLGGDVALKIVSPPLVSKWPTRPNLPINAAVGFAIGAVLSSMWVLRYKKHLINF